MMSQKFSTLSAESALTYPQYTNLPVAYESRYYVVIIGQYMLYYCAVLAVCTSICWWCITPQPFISVMYYIAYHCVSRILADIYVSILQ